MTTGLNPSPRFSIVIPTRARADTLRHSLRTALTQTFADIEVIVHESGDDADTAAVLAAVEDTRVRAFKTGEPVRMTENWERALDQVRGDYVFFLGDDDGLLPDACRIADEFFKTNDVEIICWMFAQYSWPRSPDPPERNRLVATYGKELAFSIVDSRCALEMAYRFRHNHAELPMVYNSFISRRLIEQVRAQRGRYFFGSAPDVVSGVVNAFSSSRYGRCNRPLSMAGISHHSTGQRTLSGDVETRRSADAAAFGNFIVHPTMVRSPAYILLLGNEYLIAKDALFPAQPPDLSYFDMVWTAAHTINCFPAIYDVVKENIQSICAKNGIPIERVPIAPPLSDDRTEVWKSSDGVHDLSSDRTMVNLNGDRHGVENIFEATAYLAPLLPGDVAAAKTATLTTPLQRISLSASEPTIVKFFPHGGGIRFPGQGWHEVEHWGISSLGRRAELVLPFDRSTQGLVNVRIEGQTYVSPTDPAVDIVVRWGEEVVGRQRVTVENPAVRLDLCPIDAAALGGARTLALALDVDPPICPARTVIGLDGREVGLKLERIVVSASPSTAPAAPEPAAAHPSPRSWRQRIRALGGRLLGGG